MGRVKSKIHGFRAGRGIKKGRGQVVNLAPVPDQVLEMHMIGIGLGIKVCLILRMGLIMGLHVLFLLCHNPIQVCVFF